jgi:hypothetical protein
MLHHLGTAMSHDAIIKSWDKGGIGCNTLIKVTDIYSMEATLKVLAKR